MSEPKQTHKVEYRKREAGRTPIFNRKVYQYILTCSCGWTKTVNGTRKDASYYKREHKKTSQTT